MSFLSLILIILIIWFLLPVIRVAWKIRQAKRQTRSFFNDLFGDATKTDSRRNRHPEQDKPEPKHRSKKIPDDVGEYVQFEEIDIRISSTTDSTASDSNSTDSNSTGKTSSSRTTRIQIEEQITDAEWEDIP